MYQNLGAAGTGGLATSGLLATTGFNAWAWGVAAVSLVFLGSAVLKLVPRRQA